MIVNLLKTNIDYRYLFFGRLITNMGDSLYAIASMWIVYYLSNNTVLSGVAYALNTLPSGFSFLLNPLINRFNLKFIITYSQFLQAILISILFFLSLVGYLNVYVVLIIIPIASLINSLAYYAENSLIPIISDENDLITANSGMSLAYQGTDLIFNSLAGILIALIGVTSLFALDIITFLIALVLFSKIRTNYIANEDKEEEKYIDSLKDGYRTIKDSVIWPITILTSIVNFFFGASLAIMPALASNFGGVKIYSWLMMGLSMGILFGSLCAPKFENKAIGRMMPICFLITGIFWLIFVNFESPIIMIVSLMIAAFPIGITNIILITIPQKIIEEDKIMKVFSFQGGINTLGMPLGGILGGILAKHFDNYVVFMSTGIVFILFSVYWCASRYLLTLPSASNLSLNK